MAFFGSNSLSFHFGSWTSDHDIWLEGSPEGFVARTLWWSCRKTWKSCAYDCQLATGTWRWWGSARGCHYVPIFFRCSHLTSLLLLLLLFNNWMSFFFFKMIFFMFKKHWGTCDSKFDIVLLIWGCGSGAWVGQYQDWFLLQIYQFWHCGHFFYSMAVWSRKPLVAWFTHSICFRLSLDLQLNVNFNSRSDM